MSATKPMRRTFVSLSSFEKPMPFERNSRTSSPSSTSTRLPRSRSTGVRNSASVDLPAPDRPVNHSVQPLSRQSLMRPGLACAARARSADLALEVRHLEALLVHDRSVSEVAHLAEQLAVVGGDDDVGVLRNHV